MAGYTKLFESILDSTVWGESNETRIVWITMLAMRNRRHVVEAAVPGLARRARVSIEDTEKALKRFKAPDPYSRTKDFEGRRIQEVDGGWLILNGEHYRNKLNEDERREYQRVKQKEYRNRRKYQKVEAIKEGASEAIKDGFKDIEKNGSESFPIP